MLEAIQNRQIIIGIIIAAGLFVPWTQKRKFFLLRVVAGIAAAVLLESYTFSSMWFGLALILDVAIIFAFIYLCYDCDLIHVVFSGTCAYAVQHITSKLTYGIYNLLHLEDRNSLTILGLLIVSNVLVCTIIYVTFTRKFVREERIVFNNNWIIAYSALFIVASTGLSTLIEANFNRADASYYVNYVSLNLLCILFATMTLVAELSTCKILQLENEKKILEKLLENDKEQFELAKESIEKINIRYHDLKQQYAFASDEEKARLEAEMDSLSVKFFTGNKALDVVLTQKTIICRKENIKLICSVDDNLSGISQYHIYSMLGNAIDNAIECLMQIDDVDKKVIRVSIAKHNDMSIIAIENYTRTIPVVHDGELVTTKDDAGEHGYGVKSIKNIAKQYGGTADTFVENDIFCLTITIPREKKA